MRRKVLVYATGPLGERLAGPEIRALQFARALSSDYEVTLIAQRADACERDGLPVLPSSRGLIFREAIRNNVIISPCISPYLLVAKRLFGIVTISDQYDPHEVELVALGAENLDRDLHLRTLGLTVNFRCADVVLCATEQQRVNLIAAAGRLAGPGRTIPIDPVVVPFGIPDPPPISPRQPLRDRFSQIRENDKVVLWWGAVWKWLDAETPIRAFAEIASTRPDLKLVITAGAPPNAGNQRFEAVSEARELASQLGVLGRNVLFLDEWIPYDERWDYLREADIGLTLHRFSTEAELAARSRYMDYVAAALPCVLGRGDETAAEFEASGFATLVDDPEPAALAQTIIALVDDRTRLAAAAEAGHRLGADRHMGAAAEKLRATVATSSPKPQAHPTRTLLGSAEAAGSYYARKLAARVL